MVVKTKQVERTGVDGRLIASLPSIEEVLEEKQSYAGPTEESNWVIKGRLLVGAYPADVEDEKHFDTITSILDCGITTFVCLQSEYVHDADPSTWRSCKGIRPYIFDAYDICDEAHRGNSETGPPKAVHPSQLEMLHAPIEDCGCTTDEVLLSLTLSLGWRLLRGENLYVHCWGGHGRTGTVVAILLALLYGIDKDEALKRTQVYHDLRSCALQVESPQTETQRQQVSRVIESFSNANGMKSLVIQYKAREVDFENACFGLRFVLPLMRPNTMNGNKRNRSTSETTSGTDILEEDEIRSFEPKKRRALGSLPLQSLGSARNNSGNRRFRTTQTALQPDLNQHPRPNLSSSRSVATNVRLVR